MDAIGITLLSLTTEYFSDISCCEPSNPLKLPIEKAIKIYQSGITRKDASAYNNLGVCTLFGYGITKNEKEAAKLFELAIQAGCPMALNNLAVSLLLSGQLEHYAISLFYSLGSMLPEAGNDPALLAACVRGIVNYCHTGLLLKKRGQAVEMFQILSKCLEFDSSSSLFDALGCFYLSSFGNKGHEETGVDLLNRAAKNGYAPSIRNIAYLSGEKGDRQKAHTLYIKAAEAGNLESYLDLAYDFYQGRGVEKDDKQSELWYEKAAVLGHKKAQLSYGTLLLSKNDNKGFQWVLSSCQQNFQPAIFRCAICYETGNGCDVDELKALQLYKIIDDTDSSHKYEAQKRVTKLEYRILKKIAPKYQQSADTSRSLPMSSWTYDHMMGWLSTCSSGLSLLTYFEEQKKANKPVPTIGEFIKYFNHEILNKVGITDNQTRLQLIDAMRERIEQNHRIRPSGEEKLIVKTEEKEKEKEKMRLIPWNDLTLEEDKKDNIKDMKKGKWISQNLPVTVKIFPPNLPSKNEFIESLNTLCRVRSQHLVKIHGYCINDNRIYLIMEYCPNGTLYSLLHGNQEIGFSTRVQFALEIADGLAALHCQQPKSIIHRDIRAANFFITHDFHIRIAGFGFQFSADTMQSQSQGTGGNIAYLAPELFASSPEYSEKTDIYALAIVFWELITQEDPYPSVSLNMIKEKVKGGGRPAVPPQVPPFIVELLQQCWHQDPNQRPNAQQIIDLLLNSPRSH